MSRGLVAVRNISAIVIVPDHIYESRGKNGVVLCCNECGTLCSKYLIEIQLEGVCAGPPVGYWGAGICICQRVPMVANAERTHSTLGVGPRKLHGTFGL